VFINRNDSRRETLSKSQEVCKLKTNLLVQDMKVRWNTTYDMILCLIKNEKVLQVTKLKALKLLPTIDDSVDWPLLSTQDWIELKELCPFLELFKELTLYFSTTTEPRMADVCLDFEDLLVEIKVSFLDKKEQISDQLWYAANASYTKLTKYYTKISSENFAIATVLDPRYLFDVIKGIN
jgi:hypothetical protein